MEKEISLLNIDNTKILEKELGKEGTKVLFSEIDKKIEEAFAYELPRKKGKWIAKIVARFLPISK